jgi:hypothetical protein
MKRTLGMILKILATGTISLFLAACYGLQMQWKRITATSDGTTGIRDLKVTLVDGSGDLCSQFTDAAGLAEIRYFNDMAGFTVRIEDVDGSANGTYTTREITLGTEQDYAVTMLP